ncbi:MAG: hypothetical protein GY906_01695 [bacterium]|nr:hypothetical protein [bacterium]
MGQRAGLPFKEMSFLTMQVVDWKGPIVEIRFHRPVETTAQVDTLLREANSFMRVEVSPSARQVYFVTCYDNLHFSPDVLEHAREGFARFNDRYSLGDVRYGGNAVTKTFIIAQSIKSATRSAIFETRGQAIQAIRAKL